MKYNRLGILLILITLCVVFSPPSYACTDTNCSASITCPSGFERDKEGCKTCRCTPNPKVVKTWTFYATIDCPTGQILSEKVRFFSAAWTEGQNQPTGFYWDYGPYSYDLNKKVTLTNYTPNDKMYFGLESSVMVAKKLWPNGVSQEYQELSLVGTPPHSSITYQTAFNPPTYMASFNRENLPQGDYAIQFSIPTQYKTQWCVTPTSVPPTATPIPCTPLKIACSNACGQTLKCASDGCGSKTCCPATAACESACNPSCSQGTTCVKNGGGSSCPPGAYCLMAEISPICVANTPTPTPANTCPKRPQGDANCDALINTADFDIYKSFLGKLGGIIQINSSSDADSHSSVKVDPDFNSDKKIDLVDYEIWRNMLYK